MRETKFFHAVLFLSLFIPHLNRQIVQSISLVKSICTTHLCFPTVSPKWCYALRLNVVHSKYVSQDGFHASEIDEQVVKPTEAARKLNFSCS